MGLRRRVPTEAELALFDSITESFKEFPIKPKSEQLGSSIAEHMRKNLPIIEDTLSRGYTVKQIVEAYNKGGFTISEGTFKNYLKRLRDADKSRQGGTVRRGNKRGPKSRGDTIQTPIADEGGKEKSTAAVDLQAKPEAGKDTSNEQLSVAQQAAKVSPPGTGAAKATDLKGGKEALFGKGKE